MIRTAIIAAMPGELKPLVQNPVGGWRHERRNRIHLWRWRYDTGEWVAACAGAGQNAATRALAEIEKDGPVASVLSVGWAGALADAYLPGQAYRVAGVIDTLTGERFRAAPLSESPGAGERAAVLKGHGFGRAAETPSQTPSQILNRGSALAAEGMRAAGKTVPQGLKPENISAPLIGTAKPVPFQNSDPAEAVPFPSSASAKIAPIQATRAAAEATPARHDIWLATSPKVADAEEKQRLASAYRAGLVDMEAAAIARLAAMRGISFQCIKGVSDGLNAQLPDFNRFLSPEGRFQTVRFTLFALFHPGYWSALKQMGENSKQASQSIAELALNLLDEQGDIRKRNGYPNLRR